MAVLHVVIKPDALVLADAGATLRCQILDVSQADGDLDIVVGQRVLLTEDLLAYNEDGVIQVTVELDLNADDVVLTPGRHYTVAVHVDHTGDEMYASGDLITTQSYPLPPGVFATTDPDQIEAITIELTRI